MIIGRDLLEHIRIKVLFDTQMMEWNKASTLMQDPNQYDLKETLAKLEHKLLYMHDPDTTKAERIHKILDAKYCKVDLDKLICECEQLSKEEQQKLTALFKSHEQLFDRTVCTWNTNLIDLILRDPYCTPCHTRP